MDKINNKEFLNFFEKRCRSNVPNFIKSIRFNKKSISVRLEDKNFLFNDLYTKKSLYNDIIGYLSIYIKENNLNIPYDIDYLKYKYAKLNTN